MILDDLLRLSHGEFESSAASFLPPVTCFAPIGRAVTDVRRIECANSRNCTQNSI